MVGYKRKTLKNFFFKLLKTYYWMSKSHTNKFYNLAYS